VIGKKRKKKRKSGGRTGKTVIDEFEIGVCCNLFMDALIC
jgi:hypothetical protein